MLKKNTHSALAVVLCLSAAARSLSAADATPLPAATAPSITSPAPAGAPAGRAQRPPRQPASPEDLAEMAKLHELPSFAPGAPDGDYLQKPPYDPAPETLPRADVPKGRVERFDLNAAESKFYPDTGLRDWKPTRSVTVYIPSQYVPGTAAPVIVTHDAQGARDNLLPTILDNMIADKRLPAMVAVMVTSGGGDGGGSERGHEYDTVSGKFAEFIEAEVLPRVSKDYGVTFTKDPNARATMGGSSGGAVALTMAWFHPDLYHRVLTYSGTYTNNQTPANAWAPHGAWEYHENLISLYAPKPLRIWMQVGENDNGATSASAGMKNWVIANQRMAAVLKAKGYHYQFVYSVGAGHVDRKVVAQTLPAALEWLWKDYQPAK